MADWYAKNQNGDRLGMGRWSMVVSKLINNFMSDIDVMG